MKTPFLVAIGGLVLGWSAVSHARITEANLNQLACNENKKVNCVRDGIFVLEGTPDLAPDGTQTQNPNAGNYYCSKNVQAQAGVIRWNCRFDYDKVIYKFLNLLNAAGLTPDPEQWDQAAIFLVDSNEATNFGGTLSDPLMLFFRVPSLGDTLAGDETNNGSFTGVNAVDGIGIPVLPRNSRFPFVGYVPAGSTTDFGILPSSPAHSWYPKDLEGNDKPVPPTLRRWRDPDPAGVRDFEVRYRHCNDSTLCYAGSNGYQALAQPTSMMFGPYLREEMELHGDNWQAFDTSIRNRCSPSDDTTTFRVGHSVAGPAPEENTCVSIDRMKTKDKLGPEVDALATCFQTDGGLMVETDAGDLVPFVPQNWEQLSERPRLDPDTGGRPLLDMSKHSGSRVVGSSTRPLGWGEPSLSVCPDRKQNLAQLLRPPHVMFDKETGKWKWTLATTSRSVVDTTDPSLMKPTTEISTHVTKVTPPNAAGAYYYRTRPRIWNSFIDMDGSLMGGGANWFENGNFTASNGGPNAFQIASPPYRGQRLIVFNPVELWLMGLVPNNNPANPLEGVPPIRVYDASIFDVLHRGAEQNFTNNYGPRMGMPKEGPTPGSDRILISSSSKSNEYSFRELIAGQKEEPDQPPQPEPQRTPSFAAADHFLKQVWIVVTKPEERVDARYWTGSVDDCPASADISRSRQEVCDLGQDRLDQINERHLSLMTRWRRGWQQYWYMLTGYRGRMVSTFTGTYDDSAYWEFVQKTDEEKTFVPQGGLERVVSGLHEDLNSEAILSFANIHTPGRNGSLQFTTHQNQLPLKIEGNPDLMGKNNALLVRMAFPANLRKDPNGTEKDSAYAELRLTGDKDVVIRIPGSPDGYLIPDGKYHTYTASLDTEGPNAAKAQEFSTGTYTGFTFIPSSEATRNCDPTDLDDPNCIKLDYIRFANIHWPEDIEDIDRDCSGDPRPDGWIGLEDNCPLLWNPDQSDVDGNGIGDACEDYDRDTIPNACDNCPTVSNARQNDWNDNDMGDACDPESAPGCFLQPDSVAGAGANRGALGSLALVGLAVVGLGVILRRRRR